MTVGLTLLWTVLSAAPAGSALFDASVSTSSGETVQLSQFWGRPTVVFYEDRKSMEDNRLLKQQLEHLLAQNALLRRTRVLAVANLQEYNWFPARQFALAGVKSAEVKNRIALYIDLEGSLTRAPIQLPRAGASVLLVDEQGTIVFRHLGPLGDKQRGQMFSLLEQLSKKPWQKAQASAQ
jgi:hypothetical protein